MLEWLKKAAKGILEVSAEALEAKAFIDELLNLPRDQALKELQAKLQAVDQRAYLILTVTLAGMIGKETNSIQQLKSGRASEGRLSEDENAQSAMEVQHHASPQQRQALQLRERRLQALKIFADYTEQFHEQKSFGQAAALATPAPAPRGNTSPPISNAEPPQAPAQAAPLTTSPQPSKSEPVQTIPLNKGGPCQQCIHFRPVKPSSQSLAQAIGTTDATTSNALAKIQEDEVQQKGYEAQLKSKKEIANDELWGFRPVMSDFCGLRETEGIYPIPAVKNFGGRCTEFAPGRPKERSCSTCVHRMTSQGAAEDERLLKLYGAMAGRATIVGLSSSTADSLISRHLESVPSRKAFELSGIYAANGALATKPRYFDYCGKFSSDGQYVVCVLKNPHHTCWAWEHGSAKPVVKKEEELMAELMAANPQLPLLEKLANQGIAAGLLNYSLQCGLQSIKALGNMR
jgi:hypothetical protein